jgi:NAD(P)H-quinone oxidoreductase subunit 5
MPQASEIAWLIPVFPLIGAVLSGLGLISINKKINNSREIVSVGLISFVGISAVISYKALIEQVNGYQSVENYLYGRVLAILQSRWVLSLILWGV